MFQHDSVALLPARPPLLEATPSGLYCAAGGFFIDPWRRVDRALITHAHSDHARSGMGAYLTAESGVDLVRLRVGSESVEGIAFGERRRIGGVQVSFHPAGHILGSAQIRLEWRGEVWVVTGDYKTQADISCEIFEPVRCHTLITESTFGLPVYGWPDPVAVFSEIESWWMHNQQQGRTSIIFAYALGKAQRILCGINSRIGPIGVHGAVTRLLEPYRAAGKPLPSVLAAGASTADDLRGRGLVIAPGSTRNTPWLKRFEPFSSAMASGWMAVRGNRRRQSVDRGFILSDHVDWQGLLAVVGDSGAEAVGVTHGHTGPVVRWLREQRGLQAWEVPTRSGEARPGEDED